MNHYLQTLREQIGGMAFFMMGAKNITFDNAKNELRWQIANSTISHVNVRYDVGEDLYQITFSSTSRNTVSEIVIEQLEAGELHAVIERYTRLRLSLSRIYAR